MSIIWADEVGEPDAPLVVLIHGSMDRSTGMLRLSRRLDDRFRVLRYDRRGYGRSVRIADDGSATFAMQAQVGDLLDLLCGRRALLFGHSYGGNVALATAEREPGLVAGVALYETPLSWEPWWPSTTAGSAARSDKSPADAAEQFMRRLVGDEMWESLPERTREIRRSEGRALVGELRDLMDNQPWHADAIHCPIVLGYGARGAAQHVRGMQHLHSLFPGSQLHELADCRHDAPNSHSALVAETMIGALATAAGPPWSSAVNRRPAVP